jgi:hypothetical protein
MAQEKARTTRARKKTDEPAAEKPKPATRRTRKPKPPAEPGPEAISELAYRMWERGEPGGETEHWLRAESELRAA